MTDSVTHVKTVDSLCMETPAPPCALVIFGASGDLARRKILPSLFGLQQRKLLPREFFVLGCGRTAMDDDAFRARVRESLGDAAADPAAGAFLAHCHYLAGDYADNAFYGVLNRRLQDLESRLGTVGNRIFYLAVPPDLYVSITTRLAASGLSSESESPPPWRRVVIEKPLGRDLASASRLDSDLR
jgi:glucose-6-phosphate 1-dehydrogenase